MESVPQSTAKTWKSSASAAPPGRDVDPCRLSAPECPGLCMLPCTVDGSLPMFSKTSISPLAGHGVPVKMFAPSIQNAGHIPWPRGILTRASKRPYR